MARPKEQAAPAMLLVHNAEEEEVRARSVGRTDGRTMIPWPCKLPSTDGPERRIFPGRWVSN